MIDPKDMIIDGPERDQHGLFVGSGGHSQITATHVPTGTVVTVNATSQHMSRHIAVEMIEWALMYVRYLENNPSSKATTE